MSNEPLKEVGTDADKAEVPVAEPSTTSNVMDDFIESSLEVFSELIEVSYQGNPVATHLMIVDAVEGFEVTLYDLKQTLLDSLPNPVVDKEGA